MSYDLREHTADVAVEATAPTLGGLFEAVADGLTAASCETVPEAGARFELTVSAESREALLFDYLDQLIYERDVRLVLPADHRCAIAGPDESDPGGEAAWTVEATARGVSLGDIAAREIKAVTYSEMRVEQRDDGWYAYVVFDV
jgi:SHS2 domain-containing protein